MYKYSNTTIISNFWFAGAALVIAALMRGEILYSIILVVVAAFVLKDALKELKASFELTGDRLIVRVKDKIVKEVRYKEMKYLTISRKNKRWIVIADDEKILFVIKHRIKDHGKMVNELIKLNKSNKKLEIHEFIQRTYG